MNRALIVLSLSLVALIGGSQIGRWRVMAAQESQPVTVEYSELNYTAPPSFRQDMRVFARRSDGSTAETWHNPTPGGALVQQRRIQDTQRQEEIAIDSYTKSLVRRPLGEKVILALKNAAPRSSCPGERQAESLLGREVYLLEQATGPVSVQGSRKRQVWRAPSLACLTLKTQSFVADGNNNWVLASERTAQSVQVGEPSSSLFEIPAYPVRSYQELDAEVRARTSR